MGWTVTDYRWDLLMYHRRLQGRLEKGKRLSYWWMETQRCATRLKHQTVQEPLHVGLIETPGERVSRPTSCVCYKQ